MATKKTKDIVKAHADTLFENDSRVSVHEVKRGQKPKIPRTESALDNKAYVWLQYPPTKQEARGLSGNVVPWDESGAFMISFIGAAQSKAAADLVDEVSKTFVDSLKNQTIGDDMDILNVIGAELAASWGGSVTGETFAVQFETQNV